MIGLVFLAVLSIFVSVIALRSVVWLTLSPQTPWSTAGPLTL